MCTYVFWIIYFLLNYSIIILPPQTKIFGSALVPMCVIIFVQNNNVWNSFESLGNYNYEENVGYKI